MQRVRVCVCICCYFPIQNSGNKVKERSMLFDFIFISITIGFPSFQWRYNRNAALQAHINRSIRFIHPSTLVFMTIFFFCPYTIHKFYLLFPCDWLIWYVCAYFRNKYLLLFFFFIVLGIILCFNLKKKLVSSSTVRSRGMLANNFSYLSNDSVRFIVLAHYSYVNGCIWFPVPYSSSSLACFHLYSFALLPVSHLPHWYFFFICFFFIFSLFRSLDFFYFRIELCESLNYENNNK